MASGAKEMQFNTLERALSTDMNRLQKFLGAAQAELLRQMLNTTANDDLEAGAVPTEYAISSSPLRAEIVSGFLVRPQAGNFDLRIDAGIMLAVAPDGAADDSNYKYVKDPGITSGGLLSIGVNVSGLTRIDVIECSINPGFVVEADNRDTYNPVTGLFTVGSITKAKEHRLTFRVRQGTPGSGYPGTATGWLPLCIVMIPNAAANNDACTFWDVRPMLSDREFQPFNLARSYPHNIRANVYWRPASKTDSVPVNGDFPLRGMFEATLGGRRIGGRLRRGTPGADADTTDPLEAENRDPTAPLADGDLANIYLCTPYGLPRWARYTQTNPRLPRSPRGILITSKTKPNELGFASAALLPPTSTGLLASIAATECLFVGFGHYGDFTVGPNHFEAYSGFQLVGNEMWNQYNAFTLAYGSGGLLSPAPVTATFDAAEFDLIPGTHFPKNAKYVHCKLTALGSAMLEGTPKMVDVTVFEPGSTTIGLAVYQCPRVISGHVHNVTSTPSDSGQAKNANVTCEIWLPLPHPYPGAWGASIRVKFRYEMSSGTPSVALNIRGWRF